MGIALLNEAHKLHQVYLAAPYDKDFTAEIKVFTDMETEGFVEMHKAAVLHKKFVNRECNTDVKKDFINEQWKEMANILKRFNH